MERTTAIGDAVPPAARGRDREEPLHPPVRQDGSLGAPRGPRKFPRPRRIPLLREASGFTLLELIVVIAIIGILAATAIPQLIHAPRRAAEAVLRENLFTMRSCIDQYFADKQVYPQSLSELASAGYLRRIPIDPITKSDSTWEEIQGEDTAENPDPNATAGIVDVRSGSAEVSLDGTPYNEW